MKPDWKYYQKYYGTQKVVISYHPVMIFQTIILFWLSHKSMAANTAYNLFRIQGYSIYLDSKLLIFCNVIFICQKLGILLISNSLLSFRTWGLNWLTILRIAGFFPGGGSPIRRKFCQSPHPTLVPVFGPRLVPPSRGSSPKMWKIWIHFCVKFDYF